MYISKALGQIGILAAIFGVVCVWGACCQWSGRSLHTDLTGLKVNKLPNKSQGYVSRRASEGTLFSRNSCNRWTMEISGNELIIHVASGPNGAMSGVQSPCRGSGEEAQRG